MQLIRHPKKEEWQQLVSRPVLNEEKLNGTVKDILEQVKKSGDKALKKLSLKFDGVEPDPLYVKDQEISDACLQIPVDLSEAINAAIHNIKAFHKAQLATEEKIETSAGVFCWRRNIPIEKVGLYIPGGTAPLFSTVLMLAIPAGIAGCREIILCTPPDRQGKVHPAILYAAQKTGISKIYKVGGAQAIAAMAYGTESIIPVNKIFGPGNQFVTKAKQQVNMQGVAIDMPAGPSEVLVLADDSANPEFIAADLLSQAEHGPDSQVLFLTYHEEMAEAVQSELERQLSTLPRREYAARSLQNSRLILVKDFNEAMDFSNAYAPEHLIIMVKNLAAAELKVINAGSVFLGDYSPEAAGDYASGTNHVLPTNGYAHSYSGVSVESFIRKVTFQKISKKGLTLLGPTIKILAEAEELIAHKRAVSLRIDGKDS